MLGKRSFVSEPELSEPKRSRYEENDEFFNILEDNDDDITASEEDLNGVMRSLEQEIISTTTSCSSSAMENTISGGHQPHNAESIHSLNEDLGYLLEASDDELGIGPVVIDVDADEEDDSLFVVNEKEGFVNENKSLLEIAEKWNAEDELWNHSDHGSFFGGEGLSFEGDFSTWRMETTAGM